MMSNPTLWTISTIVIIASLGEYAHADQTISVYKFSGDATITTDFIPDPEYRDALKKLKIHINHQATVDYLNPYQQPIVFNGANLTGILDSVFGTGFSTQISNVSFTNDNTQSWFFDPERNLSAYFKNGVTSRFREISSTHSSNDEDLDEITGTLSFKGQEPRVKPDKSGKVMNLDISSDGTYSLSVKPDPFTPDGYLVQKSQFNIAQGIIDFQAFLM